MDRADVLILMDGGLAGVVACALECERGLRAVAWQVPQGILSPPAGPPLDAARAATLVSEQADLYGAIGVVRAQPAGTGAPELLLGAVRAGVARGAQRVVWPVACGHSIDEMFRVTEQADLAGRLAALDVEPGAGPGLRIETPFVDLTREQLLDLARDLEVPESVWLVRASPAGSPDAAGERRLPTPGGGAAVA